MVDNDYYELQDTYKNDNVGLTVFENQTIYGITFHSHDLSKDGSFAERIKKEWAAKKLFATYTLNPGPENGWHGWIVFDFIEDEVFLRSKYSERGNGEGRLTAKSSLHISEAVPPRMSGLLFYTLPNDSLT